MWFKVATFSANRNQTGTITSMWSEKQQKGRVLIKYFLTKELSAEVTTKLEWKHDVITQKKQWAATLSYIKLKSDSWKHYLGLFKTNILHERIQNLSKNKNILVVLQKLEYMPYFNEFIICKKAIFTCQNTEV